MFKPRTAYRLTCVLIPLAAAWIVVLAVAGDWLVAAVMVPLLAGAVINLRTMRRRGYDWHWPATFAEMREGRPPHP